VANWGMQVRCRPEVGRLPGRPVFCGPAGFPRAGLRLGSGSVVRGQSKVPEWLTLALYSDPLPPPESGLWHFTLSPRHQKWEPADKPGSVVGNHSSGTAVTGGLERPTRKRRGPRHRFPIWSCSGWGLPCRSVLPPARCALTAPFHPYLSPANRIGAVSFLLHFP